MKTIIAIDPGVAGGYAVYYPECVEPHVTEGFSTMTPREIIDEFKAIRQGTGGELIAVMEDIQRFSPMPAARMAEYAMSFGVLKGALMALDFRVELVRAQKWQKELSIGSKGDTAQGKWKRKLKAKAQELFPGVNVTLQTADALLILEWAKRTLR